MCLLLILLVGGALRLLYWRDISRQADYRFPGLDAGYHDYWARSLVTGDWTPPHDQMDPQLRTNPYFRPPGYSYWLAAVYKLLGMNPHAPRAAQFALGLLNIVLAFMLARRWVGPSMGLLAAVFMATYWIFIYYEGELREPSVLVSLGLGLLLLLSEYARNPTWRNLAGAGVLLGASALVRPNILIFGATVPFWMWWMHGRRHRTVRPPVVAWALWVGIATLVILPATIRNYRASGEIVLISSNGGINLLFGQEQDGIVDHSSSMTGNWNCFDYPRVVARLSGQLGRKLTQAQASRWFSREALHIVRTSPRSALRRLWDKTLLFWGPQEVCTQEAEGCFRRASRILRWTPLSFPMVFALALTGVGLFFLWPEHSEPGRESLCIENMWLLLLYLASYFASYLPFVIGGAYRVPLIPVLLVLAAYALDRLMRAWREGHRRQALAGVVAGLTCWCLVGINYTGYQPNQAHICLARAVSLERAGDLAAAEREYRAALHHSPDLGVVHNSLGVVLARGERTVEAAAHFREAVRLEPDSVDALFNLGLALALQGYYAEAADDFGKAVTLQPQHADAHYNLGLAYAFQEKFDEAAVQFQEVLNLKPDHVQAAEFLRQVTSNPPRFTP